MFRFRWVFDDIGPDSDFGRIEHTQQGRVYPLPTAISLCYLRVGINPAPARIKHLDIHHSLFDAVWFARSL
jgi:hypothetical protein